MNFHPFQSYLDDIGLKATDSVAKQLYAKIELEQWDDVQELYGRWFETLLNHTTHVSLYNIMNVLPIRKGEEPCE